MSSDLEKLRVTLQQMHEQQRRHSFHGIAPDTNTMIRKASPWTQTRATVDFIEKRRPPERPTKVFKGVIKFNQARNKMLKKRAEGQQDGR